MIRVLIRCSRGVEESRSRGGVEEAGFEARRLSPAQPRSTQATHPGGKDYGEIPILHPNCIAGSWLVHAGLALRR